MSDFPKWKRDLFATRQAGRCQCEPGIPGVLSERHARDCPVHPWAGDPVAEEGGSIVENDAIQAEHRTNSSTPEGGADARP